MSMTPSIQESARFQSLSEEQFLTLKDLQDQYKHAMTVLNSIGMPMMTIYGGARVGRKTRTYQEVFELSKKMGEHGWAVATGGGPGVMEAALLGVKAGGGTSVGFKINIASEVQDTQNDIDISFTQFAPRKYALRQADAFVFAPGGIGTFDELFELFTLNKTGKFADKKAYFLDSRYWRDLVDWLLTTVYEKHELMSPEALTFLKLVDDPQEIVDDLVR